MDFRKLVTTNQNEARIILSRLTADGVVAEVRGPTSAYPMGAASVYVLDADFERATDLLNVAQASDPWDDAPTEMAIRRRRSMRIVGGFLALVIVGPIVWAGINLLREILT
jgi:hypothetical protein